MYEINTKKESERHAVTTDTSLERPQLEVDRSTLLEMYRYMVLTRATDNRARALYLQGKVVGGVYSQMGHEAISVGSASTLRPDDILAPMHRDLGAHLVRGMDLRLIFSQLLARGGGYTQGRDNALHIGDLAKSVLPQISMLGTSIPLAAGAALVAKQRDDGRVSMTYVGDGAVNTGDFHEGLNFAAVLNLPMILLVENNQWAYSTPVSKQVRCVEIAQRAEGYGIPGIRIDGNDVVAVYQTTLEAVNRARAGDGPTLIECVTMRMRGHSEGDSASYVPRELLAEWSGRDPIDRFVSVLLSNDVMDEATRDAVASEVEEQVTAASDWALQQPMPDPETVTQGVYRTPLTSNRHD